MKKVMLLLFVLLAVIVFSCTACGKASMNTSTPHPSDSEQEEEADDSEGSLSAPVINKQEENPPDDAELDEPGKRSTTYEPSIFVIEASGSGSRTDAGLKVNHECELYLDKIEPHNMHDDMGAYTAQLKLK